MRGRILLILTMLLVPRSMHAAEPAPLASCFPPETISIVEIPKPNTLTAPLTRWMVGSVLGDPLTAVEHARKQPNSQPVERAEMAFLSLIASPEGLSEWALTDGMALGVIVPKPNDPAETVLVIRTGQSRVLPLAMRMLLIASPTMRQVETRGRIHIHQLIQVDPSEDVLRVPGAPEVDPKAKGPTLQPTLTIATGSGLVVIGDHLASVRTVLDLATAKQPKASLAMRADYQAVRAKVEPANPFFWAPFTPAKAATPQTKPSIKTLADALLHFAIRPEKIHGMTGELVPQGDAIHLRLRLEINPAEASPLVDLLAGPVERLPTLMLTDSTLHFAMGMPTGPDRAAKILKAADAIAKSVGTLGALPSELADELARRDPPMNLRQAISGLRGICVDHSRQGETVLLLHSDEASTDGLLAVLPTVMELLGIERPDPVRETIEGFVVRSIVLRKSRLGPTLHYAARPGLIAVASDRAWLVKRLRAAEKSSTASSESPEPILQGQLAWGQLWSSRLPAIPKAPSKPPMAVPVPIPVPVVEIGEDRDENDEDAESRDERIRHLQRRSDLIGRLAKGPPLKFRLDAKTTFLELTLDQPGMPMITPKLLDLMLQRMGIGPQLDHQPELNEGPTIEMRER